MPTLLEHCGKNREKWLEMRAGKIGGSSAYHAANIDERAQPLKAWLELRGQGESQVDDEPGKGWRYWGHKFEPVLGEAFCEKYIYEHPGTDIKILSGDFLQQHPRRDFAIATPDFLMAINGEVVSVQTKTRNSRRWEEYEGENEDDQKLPNEDRAQCIHEMGVLEEFQIRRSYLAAFFYPETRMNYREPELIYREVTAEPEHFEILFDREQILVDQAARGEVPDLKNMTSEQAAKLYLRPVENIIDLHGNEEFESLCSQYIILGKREKDAAEAKEKISKQILGMIGKGEKGDCAVASVPVIRASWDELDSKKLKNENPVVYKQLLATYGRNRLNVYPRIYPKK